jgi:hypothetical protein
MSSCVIYSGKMTVPNYMDDENLYIVFPSGLGDDNLASVLGTWTVNAEGTENAPLTMVNYPCEYITSTEFFIVKDDSYYRLRVKIASDTEIDVTMLNENDVVVSDGASTLTLLT